MLEDTYLYNILGVQPGATLAELHKFYFLQAREVHPDRNHGNPTAGHKFQMLGEAFQVLSDSQQREAYDLYGRTAIRFDGLLDATVVYGMMFGSDAFEEYLGQSRVAAVVAFGGGEKPREAVLTKLRVAQREREAKLVRHLVDRLGRFREGEQDSHFASWAAEEARQLADAVFGEELLRRVGSAYERRSAAGVGSSSLLSTQHGGADWTCQAGDTVSSQVSAAAGGVQALAMQEDADDFEGDGHDLTEETLTAFFDSSRRASPEVIWKLQVADINATLASVCSQVLSDVKCDQETLRSRAKALKKLGSIFMATAAQSKRKEAASQGGAVPGGSGMGSRVYASGGVRFSEYSPPSTPTPSGFGSGNNPSLQGLHQGEGQGYAGMAHGGKSHEQFLSARERLGAGSGDVGLPPQRGDGGDLALEGMGRGSKMYHTRYFIIKSLNHQNIASSIEKGCWATQAMNEPKLNEAYDTAENVVLIFSVNMSGHFQGYARMLSPIGRRRANIWNESNDGGAPWGGLFSVQWERLYDLPFQKTVHLKNPLNMFKPVKISRDCQELTAEIGEALCALIDEGADKEGRPKRKVIAGDYSTQDAGMKRPRGSEQMYFSSDPPFPGGAQAGSAHTMHMAPPSNTAMMYRTMPGRFMAGGAPPMGGYPPGGGGRMLPALHSPYSAPDLDYPGSRSRRQVSPASTALNADVAGEKSGGGGGEREPPRMKGREELRMESDRHVMRERAVDLEDNLEGGSGWFGGSRQEVKRTGGGRRTNGRGGLPPEEELLNMTYEEYLQRVGAGSSFAGYEGGGRPGYSSASRQGAGYGSDYGMTAGGGYGLASHEGIYGAAMSYRAARPSMGSGSEYGGSMSGYSPPAGSIPSAGYDEGWGAGVGPEGYGTSLHQPHSGMFGGAHGSRNMGGRE